MSGLLGDRCPPGEPRGDVLSVVEAKHFGGFEPDSWISRWEREAEANGPAVGLHAHSDAGLRSILASRLKH